jgi:hypothetical protein
LELNKLIKSQTNKWRNNFIGMELSKEKKKRQPQAKCRNQPDMTTEFDILQQRIKESVSHLSHVFNLCLNFM